jgi:hypothetical protein
MKDLLKQMHPTYFKLNVHQKINARQLRNGLNINHIFATKLYDFDYVAEDIECDHYTICPVNTGIYHHFGKRHSQYPRYGKVKLRLLRKMTANYHHKHYANGGSTEFDKSINDISRDKIETIDYLHGQCFLWKGNIYNEDEKICVPYRGQRIYNFCADIVTPHYDQRLYDAIKKWNSKGVLEIEDRLDFVIQIYDYACDRCGGVELSWA